MDFDEQLEPRSCNENSKITKEFSKNLQVVVGVTFYGMNECPTARFRRRACGIFGKRLNKIKIESKKALPITKLFSGFKI